MMENKIKEYIKNGGRIFSIREISTIRDGGTKQINCVNGDTFFINKDTLKFHYRYPTDNENIIKDELLKIYLMDVIEKYVIRQGEAFERNIKLLEKLKNVLYR
jgi:hypothetical protein